MVSKNCIARALCFPDLEIKQQQICGVGKVHHLTCLSLFSWLRFDVTRIFQLKLVWLCALKNPGLSRWRVLVVPGPTV